MSRDTKKGTKTSRPKSVDDVSARAVTAPCCRNDRMDAPGSQCSVTNREPNRRDLARTDMRGGPEANACANALAGIDSSAGS